MGIPVNVFLCFMHIRLREFPRKGFVCSTRYMHLFKFLGPIYSSLFYAMVCYSNFRWFFFIPSLLNASFSYGGGLPLTLLNSDLSRRVGHVVGVRNMVSSRLYGYSIGTEQLFS